MTPYKYRPSSLSLFYFLNLSIIFPFNEIIIEITFNLVIMSLTETVDENDDKHFKQMCTIDDQPTQYSKGSFSGAKIQTTEDSRPVYLLYYIGKSAWYHIKAEITELINRIMRL